MMRRLVSGLALAASLYSSHPAAADDINACNAAIASAERRSSMPKRVMSTIALVESGRTIGKQVVPWPWSINVGGVGYYYASKDEAIDAVRRFTAAGQRSIDVGCMQINLVAHPTAFDSLDNAFEPAVNAEYAAPLPSLAVSTIGQALDRHDRLPLADARICQRLRPPPARRLARRGRSRPDRRGRSVGRRAQAQGVANQPRHPDRRGLLVAPAAARIRPRQCLAALTAPSTAALLEKRTA